MGFFDRLTGRKAAPPSPSVSASEPSTNDGTPSAAANTRQRLATARERLDAHDLPAALALYEEVLQASGDRADVLVTISGDLGATGHIRPIIELIAPRYDANRHGPAIGLNILQAYLATRDADSAQHVLDLLFALNRPELEDRLHGYSNAIADLLTGNAASPAAQSQAGVLTLSKPVWLYGLESLESEVLPPKQDRLRRIAFVQFCVPPAAEGEETGAGGSEAADLGRLSRNLPLWLADVFSYSALYAPLYAATLGTDSAGARRPSLLAAEWTPENLRQLAATATGGLDYAVTGALDRDGDEQAVILRIWDVRKLKDRKQLTAKWTRGTAEAELNRLRDDLCAFMEWSPRADGGGLPWVPPPAPGAWIDALGASFSLFLHEKGLLPRTLIGPLDPSFAALATLTADSPSASLAWLTLHARAAKAGLDLPASEPTLSDHPIVARARAALGGG